MNCGRIFVSIKECVRDEYGRGFSDSILDFICNRAGDHGSLTAK